MDEEILSILGIDSVEDLTHEEYLSLLKEASVRAQMKGSAISKDALIRITKEIKRVRSESTTATAKGTSQEEVRKRKVNPQKVFASAPKPVQKTGGTAGQKLLAAGKEKQAEDEKETRALTVIIPSALNTLAAGVNNVVKVMVKDLTMEKKQSEAERKAAENLGRAEKEEDSEKKVEEKTKKFFKGFKPPKLGIFDRLKNFVTNVALGGLLTWLTKPENQDKVKKFTDFIEDHGYKILVGIAGLLALGIGAQIIGFIGSLIGLGAILVPLLKVIAVAALAVGAIELARRFENVFRGGDPGREFDDKADADAKAAGIDPRNLVDSSGKTTNAGAYVLNPDGSPKMVNLYDIPGGTKPSLLGRKPQSGENRNARTPLNINNPKHREYIKKTESEEALQKYDDALKLFNKRIKEKDEVKESMKAEWEEITGKSDWDFLGAIAELSTIGDEEKRKRIEELNERYSQQLSEVYQRNPAPGAETTDTPNPNATYPDDPEKQKIYNSWLDGREDGVDLNAEFEGLWQRGQINGSPHAKKGKTPSAEPVKPTEKTETPASIPLSEQPQLSKPSASEESGYERQLRLMKEAMTKVDVTVVPVKKDKAGVGAGARGGQNIIDKFSVVDQTNVSIAAVAGVYNSPIPRA